MYHRKWWDSYVDVNRRFAEATARAAAPGATVWVQDYQLQLVPKMLRMLRPDVTIGFFLHIPFPPVELFMQMPWRTEIVEGLLGADLVGFHLAGGAQNFLVLSRRLVGANTSRASIGVRSRFGEVSYGFRTVTVGAFPFRSTPPIWTQRHATGRFANAPGRSAPSSATRARSCSASTGSTTPRGIDVRLRAFTELLEEDRIKRDDTVLVQLATPSRERVESYIAMREDIERQVGHINGEYGEVGHPLVHYLHRPVPRDELIAFFVAADVMLVARCATGSTWSPRSMWPAAAAWRSPGAVGVHGGGSRVAPGLPDQSARSRGRQGRDRGRADAEPRGGQATDACATTPGAGA